jgi:hypothetical protein
MTVERKSAVVGMRGVRVVLSKPQAGRFGQAISDRPRGVARRWTLIVRNADLTAEQALIGTRVWTRDRSGRAINLHYILRTVGSYLQI